MKKNFAVILSTTIALVVSPIYTTVSANNNICPPGYQNLCEIDFSATDNLISLITIIAIILSIFFLIWGGIKWVMSGGDKGKIEQARSAIIASIVGLVVSLLAYFIVSVVVRIFTGREGMNLPIPTLY